MTEEVKEQEQEQIAPRWTEAPASVTIKAYSPTGFDVLITFRDDDTKGLMPRMVHAIQWLEDQGFQQKTNGYIPAHASAPKENGEAPTCNLHNRPMKPSTKFNGWYCSVKLADGSYCKEQVKNE